MNLNKIGKNAKKAKEGISNKIFGVTKPPKSSYLKILRKAGLVERIYPHTQTEKVLREIEFKRSRAIEFVRRFQNR